MTVLIGECFLIILYNCIIITGFMLTSPGSILLMWAEKLCFNWIVLPICADITTLCPHSLELLQLLFLLFPSQRRGQWMKKNVWTRCSRKKGHIELLHRCPSMLFPFSRDNQIPLRFCPVWLLLEEIILCDQFVSYLFWSLGVNRWVLIGFPFFGNIST